jgi:hypothetical protein
MPGSRLTITQDRQCEPELDVLCGTHSPSARRWSGERWRAERIAQSRHPAQSLAVTIADQSLNRPGFGGDFDVPGQAPWCGGLSRVSQSAGLSIPMLVASPGAVRPWPSLVARPRHRLLCAVPLPRRRRHLRAHRGPVHDRRLPLSLVPPKARSGRRGGLPRQ